MKLVDSLELRLEGSQVTAKLTCNGCGGVGFVADMSIPRPYYIDYADTTNHPSVVCPQCDGKCWRRLESTHPDFTACWQASVAGCWTAAERAEKAEAKARLLALESESVDAAIRERESWPFECERCHKLHDRVLSIGCIACGSKLVARMDGAPADLNAALDRVAASIPALRVAASLRSAS